MRLNVPVGWSLQYYSTKILQQEYFELYFFPCFRQFNVSVGWGLQESSPKITTFNLQNNNIFLFFSFSFSLVWIFLDDVFGLSFTPILLSFL